MEIVRRRSAEETTPTAPPRTRTAPLPVDPAAAVPAAVQVIWGPMVEQFALVGMTVRDVRALLQRPYNIPADAPALVNGRLVNAGHQLVAGDVLEFAHRSGEKGADA